MTDSHSHSVKVLRAVSGMYMNVELVEAVTGERPGRDRHAVSDSMLDAVFEHLPAMLVVLDARTLRYLRMNKAAERMFDRPAGAVLGLTPAQSLPAGQARQVEQHCRNALRTLRAVEVPEVAVRVGLVGWRFIKATIVPILDRDGAPLYLLGILEDISERIKARTRLRRRLREAEAASRAKSAFLATMSHEIRTSRRRAGARRPDAHHPRGTPGGQPPGSVGPPPPAQGRREDRQAGRR